jgi:hypothetical protein
MLGQHGDLCESFILERGEKFMLPAQGWIWINKAINKDFPWEAGESRTRVKSIGTPAGYAIQPVPSPLSFIATGGFPLWPFV